MSETQSYASYPKVSILIPVYNIEKYVARCLRSLFANTIISDCEVIVVDDCSPDCSMKVVADVLNEFPAFSKNVILRSHDYNRGLAAARNTALLQAHGKYIVCVDSDDWVEPDYLEKLYAAAEKDNADVVMCDLIKKTKEKSEMISEIPFYGDCLSNLLLGNLHGWLHEKLIKHSLFMEHKISWIEGLNICEDLLIMTKVFFYAKKVVHVPKPLYHYDCTNQKSLTFSLNRNKVEQLKKVILEIEKFLPLEYSDYINVQKSRTKIWILKGQKNHQKEDFMLYNSDSLSKCKLNLVSSRLFFLLCEKHFFFLLKFILIFKR
ncbi:MAG: glycosyltransferase family 2 protein [Treponema sp.]|nr:glycosyltransferase family 2 protein [Treponema sp.]